MLNDGPPFLVMSARAATHQSLIGKFFNSRERAFFPPRGPRLTPSLEKMRLWLRPKVALCCGTLHRGYLSRAYDIATLFPDVTPESMAQRLIEPDEATLLIATRRKMRWEQ